MKLSLAEVAPAELESEQPQHDPWANLQQENTSTDNWLLSYVDVLTLLLVLMVVLLMLQHAGNPESEVALVIDPPQVVEQKAELGQASPEVAAAESQHEPMLPPESLLASARRQDPGAVAREDTDSKLSLLTEGLASSQGPLPALKKDSGSTNIDLDIAPKREPVVQESLPRVSPYVQVETKDVAPPFDLAPLVEALRWRGLGNGVTLSSSATQVRLETRDHILFSNASAELTESGADLLIELTTLLARYPGIISVEGHADSRPIVSGPFPSNWELSSARAASVVRYLVEQGIDAERLRAIGYGDTRPRSDNASAEGRAANRRVSLVLELNPEDQGSRSIQRSSM